jgi:hypothetical protein
MTYFERENIFTPYQPLNQLIGNLGFTSARGDRFFYTSNFFKNYYFGQSNIVLVRLFHILTIDGG